LRAETPDTTSARPNGVTVELLPPRVRAGSLVFLPKLYYASETRLGVGGDVLVPFRLAGEESSVRVRGRITATGKSDARIAATLGTGGDGHTLRTALSYSSIPIRFYGIGPETDTGAEETYEPQAIDAYAEFLHPVTSALRLGLRVEVQQHRLFHLEQGGLLITRSVRGSTGRVIAGTGLVAQLDTRDRTYSPTRGWHHEGFALFFDDEIGSEHDFNNYHADLRRYDRIGSTVVATQIFWFSVRGRPPFWRYAALGGRAHTRGYRKARYIDRDLLSGQIELRRNLWGRCGGVVFGGLAGVAPRLGSMRLDTIRPTYGVGVRYAVGTRSGLNVALDVAYGTLQDQPRLYLRLDEAF
jgi:hypothetical protein